jgi:hypothetical protein
VGPCRTGEGGATAKKLLAGEGGIVAGEASRRRGRGVTTEKLLAGEDAPLPVEREKRHAAHMRNENMTEGKESREKRKNELLPFITSDRRVIFCPKSQ